STAPTTIRTPATASSEAHPLPVLIIPLFASRSENSMGMEPRKLIILIFIAGRKAAHSSPSPTRPSMVGRIFDDSMFFVPSRLHMACLAETGWLHTVDKSRPHL